MLLLYDIERAEKNILLTFNEMDYARWIILPRVISVRVTFPPKAEVKGLEKEGCFSLTPAWTRSAIFP